MTGILCYNKNLKDIVCSALSISDIVLSLDEYRI